MPPNHSNPGAPRKILLATDLSARGDRALDIELPEGTDFGTIAGLCLSLAGRVPTTGEHFVTTDGIELEVVDASERRIRTVRVRTPKPADT